MPPSPPATFKLHLVFGDRLGIVADVSQAMARHGLNIVSMEVARRDQLANLYLTAEALHPETDRDAFLSALQTLPNLEQIKFISALPREKREDQFRVVLDNISEGILSVDNQGRITTINRKARELLDCRHMSLLGKPVSDLPLPDHPILDCLNGHSYTNARRHFVTAAGRMRFLATGKPIVDTHDQVTGAVEILMDMQEASAVARALDQPTRITFSDFIGQSVAIRQAIGFAQKIAQTDSIVAIRGASGTGKELFARAIHAESGRPGPFVPVNCAALPETLLESELFGYVGGAFTGARRKGKPGLFEIAVDGTIFLDEIGEMPPGPQAKILRLIQEKQVRRIGGSREFPVNTRIITATNQNLEQMVARNQFRQDLYYRINVLPIHIPPLTERTEDIDLLADYFLKQINKGLAIPLQILTPKAKVKLAGHDWPGNVRELKNVMSRAAILCESNTIDAAHILLSHEIGHPVETSPNATETATPAAGVSLAQQVKDLETQIITQTITQTRSIRAAARALGVSHTTLRNKIRKHNIALER